MPENEIERHLFVHPIRRLNSKPCSEMPHELCMMMALSEGRGVTVSFTDIDAFQIGLDMFRDEMRPNKFDLVCIYCDSFSYRFVKQYLPIIRLHQPKAKIIMTSPLAKTQYAIPIMQWNPEIDMMIGPDPYTWLQLILAHEYKRWLDVNGVFLRQGDKVLKTKDLAEKIVEPDAMPDPAFGFLNFERYFQASSYPFLKLKARFTMTSWRGPWRCSPEAFARQLFHVRYAFGADFISIADKDFLADKVWMRAFFQHLDTLDLTLHVRLGMETRIESFDDELYPTLKSYGIQVIKLKRPSNLALLKDVSQKIMQQAIIPICDFPIGLPNQLEKDIEVENKLLGEMSWSLSGTFYTPVPEDEDWRPEFEQKAKEEYGNLENYLVNVGGAEDLALNISRIPNDRLIYIQHLIKTRRLEVLKHERRKSTSRNTV